MPAPFYTLAVWCTLWDSWGSLLTSERGEVVTGLAERMTAILPVQVRIIETVTGDDEEIVKKLLKLKRPRVRNIDDPANDGFAGHSVFDDIE